MPCDIFHELCEYYIRCIQLYIIPKFLSELIFWRHFVAFLEFQKGDHKCRRSTRMISRMMAFLYSYMLAIWSQSLRIEKWRREKWRWIPNNCFLWYMYVAWEIIDEKKEETKSGKACKFLVSCYTGGRTSREKSISQETGVTYKPPYWVTSHRRSPEFK